MDKLADWPGVLRDFKKLLMKSTKVMPISPSVDPQDRDGAIRLLRFIGRNTTTRSYTAIESNFLYAAMHLACMKDLCFSSETCPDLPDNLESLIATWVIFVIYSFLYQFCVEILFPMTFRKIWKIYAPSSLNFRKRRHPHWACHTFVHHSILRY